MIAMLLDPLNEPIVSALATIIAAATASAIAVWIASTTYLRQKKIDHELGLQAKLIDDYVGLLAIGNAIRAKVDPLQLYEEQLHELSKNDDYVELVRQADEKLIRITLFAPNSVQEAARELQASIGGYRRVCLQRLDAGRQLDKGKKRSEIVIPEVPYLELRKKQGDFGETISSEIARIFGSKYSGEYKSK